MLRSSLRRLALPGVVLPGLALLAGTVPGHALDVVKTLDVAAPPAKVWTVVGDFCGIGTWHPAIEKCALSSKDGQSLRTLSLKGGGTIVESQVSRDEGGMAYTYTILEGPLPVSDYTSTLSVSPSGSGSKLTWKGGFQAKGVPDPVAVDAISGIYESGLKAIGEKAK